MPGVACCHSRRGAPRRGDPPRERTRQPSRRRLVRKEAPRRRGRRQRRGGPSRSAQVRDEERELRARRSPQLEPALGLPAAEQPRRSDGRGLTPHLAGENGEEAERLLSTREEPLEHRQGYHSILLLDGARELEDLARAMLAHHRAHLRHADPTVLRASTYGSLGHLAREGGGIVADEGDEKLRRLVAQLIALGGGAGTKPGGERAAG